MQTEILDRESNSGSPTTPASHTGSSKRLL